MEVKEELKRVRINISQTAKWLVQIDCTAEYADAVQCEMALDDAIKAARRVIEANGMKEVTA